MSAKAAVGYAVTIFAIGFLFGAPRVRLLAPPVGSTMAEIRPRMLVGAMAFLTLMILEIALAS